MDEANFDFHHDLRQQVARQAALQGRQCEPATAVYNALLVARINVQRISLDHWKAIIFDAFRAARNDLAS